MTRTRVPPVLVTGGTGRSALSGLGAVFLDGSWS